MRTSQKIAFPATMKSLLFLGWGLFLEEIRPSRGGTTPELSSLFGFMVTFLVVSKMVCSFDVPV